MAEVITETFKKDIEKTKIINQCDIFKDVEFIEYVKEVDSVIEVSKIVFPLAMVLTQACDLQQDFNARDKISNEGKGNQDKFLLSVLMTPIYNFEDFRNGKHLEQIDFYMDDKGRRNKSLCDNIIKNENKRYHYLNFSDDIDIVESVIDFKHYFTVTMNYLNKIQEEGKYVCSIKDLYKELIVQRFSNFLSRIGLPDP